MVVLQVSQHNLGSGFANVGNDEPATRFENAHSVRDRDKQGGKERPFSVEGNGLSDRAVSPLKRAFPLARSRVLRPPT
jgi:hypothetical protein